MSEKGKPEKEEYLYILVYKGSKLYILPCTARIALKAGYIFLLHSRSE